MRRLLQTLATGITTATLLLVPALPAGAATGPVRLASGSVSPAVITAGETATQTITLTRKAPRGGVDVALYGDVVYQSFTGGHVVVPAGRRSVSFPIRVASPEVTTVVPLYAQVPGSDLVRIAEVTVLPGDPAAQGVVDLRFSPAAAVEGSSVTGTVVLAAPAATGGVAVTLWSNTSYGPNVYVPPSVVVPAGQTSVSFTAVVNQAQVPAVVRPSAHLGTTRATGRLAVVPPTFAVGPGYVARGAVNDVVVGIGTAANPTGVTIALHSDRPDVVVPATVQVPAGSPGVIFPVTVAADASVSEPGTITATWNGTTVSNTFVVGYN
ncbi:hypothetical protein ACFO0M_05680 [Micromonospora mangrovi]|uniref:IPT/TIG domain-containing protein n=2 Tax=Micromonospora TaxID=1873 RepID=A0AAU7M1Y0_9ACTN